MTDDRKYKCNPLNAERRPSIAVVIPQYGRIGGAENMAFQLCERLAAMFDIHVFARKWDEGPSPVTFHKVPMIHFPRWLQPISFAGFAQRKIAGMAFDLVHSHERIFRMDVMTFHGIPHRTWIHDMRQKSLSGFDRATCWAEKKGIENPALKMILPVSTLVKNELSRSYAISEDRVSVMHPGVSIARFSGLDARSCRERIRANHGLSASDVVICFVGMNFEIKRLDLTLQGIAGMKRDGFFPALPRILIVGKGNSGPYLKMAKELGIGDQVVFAGVTDEVEAYYLASDLFVMPSRMDTFGLVVLEAMAAGLPVVISATVGAADLVTHGGSGFILPEHPTAQDMTASLIRLMNPERRRSMGETARQIAGNHDWDKVAAKMAKIYRSLIAGLKTPEEYQNGKSVLTKSEFLMSKRSI
jgi:UDP-glucose:(heptosyl)LPS alpha-1,3-glucosyltransferase